MIRVEDVHERQKLFLNFKVDMQDTLIDAAYHGYHGRVLTNDLKEPKILLIDVGHTHFFYGAADHEQAENLIKQVDQYAEMHADKAWQEKILNLFKEAEFHTRYEMDGQNLELEHLHSLANMFKEELLYQRIDQDLYQELKRTDWTSSMVENFQDQEDFLSNGLGFVLKNQDGKILAGASSFVRYSKGYEVEIATHIDHRRRGYALSIGAYFIKEASLQGMQAHWDAANLGSKILAEKLGYVLKKVYTIIDV
jgi:hypothetical protein